MRFIAFVLLVFVIFPPVFSQRYSFISFSTPEGLPQSQVNSITQDEAGYLWVGTFEGLARFDGNKFSTFNKATGLLSNRIYELSFVNDRLYIGHDNGISYQVENDSFAAIAYPEEVARATVTDFHYYANRLFVATNGAGMYVLDDEKKQLTLIQDSPQRIRGLTTLNNVLYLATREGVFSYVENEGFTFQSVFGEISFSSIHSRNNSIFATSYEGLLLASRAKMESVDTLFQNDIHRFRNVLITKKGDFWLNSMNGLYKLGNDQKIIELTEKSGLPINDVSSVFNDREGNIWIGTGGKGLLKFSGDIFTHFDRKSGLFSDIVISCLQDQNGVYWISSFDKGAFKMWFEKGDITPKVEETSELAYRVWSSAKSESNLFFGSVAGLYIFDGEKWDLHTTEQGLPAEKITGIYAAKGGEVWVGTANGIAVYRDNEYTKIMQNDPRLFSVRDFIVRDNIVYLAAQRGFYSIDDSENINIIKDFDGGVNTIEEDDNGRIWIGTENGLYVFKDGSIHPFSLKEDTRNEYINFLARYENRIYVGTNGGMFEVDTDSELVVHYGINAGLVDLETNLNSAFIDADNNLWFGTVAGLMQMNLNAKRNILDSPKPKIHLKDIKVNYSSISKEKFKSEDLTYKSNNVSFVFDGLYLTNPNALTYTYRLKGFSDDYSPPTANNVVTFTNLPHGNYELEVKAQVSNYQESDVFRITFTVTPPFYRTWLFYGFSALVVIGLLIGIDRYRVKVINAKNYKEQLEFRNKLANLEQQSLNASMNRHFIFNSLNAIQYFINSSDKLAANRFLNRFAKLIRKNLDASNQQKGLVTLQDELDRLELYMELENMRFNDKFSYEVLVEDFIETEALHVPAMFLQPFVENSIIHGVLPLRDRKGKVEVLVTDHLDHIRIEIRDNGIGIDQSRKVKKESPGDHKSQGMLITKGRIELLQKFSAKSITLIGPRQINEKDGLIKGTQVIFKILKVYLEE